MSEAEEIQYTLPEIRSFLPTGWRLAPEPANGRWNRKERFWTLEVLDGSDLEWWVRVGIEEARSLGRLEALRQAMRRTSLRC